MEMRLEKPQFSLHHIARDNMKEVIDEWITWFKEDPMERISEMTELDEFGYTPLHYAAKSNSYDILHKLLSEVENDSKESYLEIRSRDEKRTALHFAASYIPKVDEGQESLHDRRKSSARVVLFLLRSVKADGRDCQKYTALHLACRSGNHDVVDTMLRRDSLVKQLHWINSNMETPLHEACLNGHTEVVKQIIKYVNIFDESTDTLYDILSKTNSEQKTPLHWASQEGHTEIINSIVKTCKKSQIQMLLEMKDNEDNTPFHLACFSGSLGSVQIIINIIREQKIVVKGNLSGLWPLHIAAYIGNVDIAALLVADGISANIQDLSNHSPLHLAARNGDLKMVQYLINQGADVFMKDNESHSPLMAAVYAGQVSVYKELLTRMKQVSTAGVLDDVDNKGRTVFHLAAQMDKADLLKAMVVEESGASEIQEVGVSKLLNSVDNFFNTPLHLAVENRSIRCVHILLDCKDIRVNLKNASNKTALHVAAELGHGSAINLLLHNGAKVLDEDEKGKTPLHLACGNGHCEAVRLLVMHKSELNDRSFKSTTPLDEAAANGHGSIVEDLIKAGADINPKSTNKSRAPPLYLAAKFGHLEVVKILLESKAKVSLEDPKTKTTPLEVAIKEGHESVAMEIIGSKQWEESLKRITSTDTEKGDRDIESDDTSHHSTPFRELIKSMPLVAYEVLTRCSKMKDSQKQDKYLNDFQSRKSFLLPSIFRRQSNNGNQQNLESVEERGQSNHRLNSECKWPLNGYKKDNHPLSIMVKYDRTDLLNHPVVNRTLSKKWKPALLFHVLNISVYLIFLIFLTMFALTAPNPQSLTCQSVEMGMFGQVNDRIYECIAATSNTSAISSANVDELTGRDICSSNNSRVICGVSAEDCGECSQGTFHKNFLRVAAAIVIITASVRLIMEFFQMLVYRIVDYVTSYVNWIEIIQYLCSIIFSFVFFNGCLCPRTWQWQIGSIAIFLAWIVLIINVRKLPCIGIYVLMFENIFITFWKMFLLTLMLIIAFSLSFYMLFEIPTKAFVRSSFSTPGRALIKTMTMTTGELDFDDLFRQFPGGADEDEDIEEIPFLEVSFLMWIIFVILMPILLSNLLTGLAVDDIQAIQNAAKLKRLELRVELVLSLEASLPHALQDCLHYCSYWIPSSESLISQARRIESRLTGRVHVDSNDDFLEPDESANTDNLLSEMRQMKDSMQLLMKKMASMEAMISAESQAKKRI